MSLDLNFNYRGLKDARNRIIGATEIYQVLSRSAMVILNDTISSRYRINSDQIRDLQASSDPRHHAFAELASHGIAGNQINVSDYLRIENNQIRYQNSGGLSVPIGTFHNSPSDDRFAEQRPKRILTINMNQFGLNPDTVSANPERLFQHRLAQFLEFVQKLNPDTITVQESSDRAVVYEQMATLGYSSASFVQSYRLSKEPNHAIAIFSKFPIRPEDLILAPNPMGLTDYRGWNNTNVINLHVALGVNIGSSREQVLTFHQPAPSSRLERLLISLYLITLNKSSNGIGVFGDTNKFGIDTDDSRNPVFKDGKPNIPLLRMIVNGVLGRIIPNKNANQIELNRLQNTLERLGTGYGLVYPPARTLVGQSPKEKLAATLMNLTLDVGQVPTNKDFTYSAESLQPIVTKGDKNFTDHKGVLFTREEV